MKSLKRTLIILIVIFSVTIMYFNEKIVNAFKIQEKPVKVAVFLVDFNNDFISIIGNYLENIQKENPDKVEFTFYDGKSDQTIQNQQINKVLSEGVDLILLNIVNRGSAREVINRIKETNIPVILFNREPLTALPIQSYDKALYIGTNAKQAGILQGKMLVDVWNTSKSFIDKNKDNIMQYVMLQGEGDDTEAIERTKYSISAIEDAGIKTQQVSLKFADWQEDLAYEAVKKLFSEYGEDIEVIIANDDSMAIGAIKALQEQGYNTGDRLKTIPVVGMDVTPVAKELIEKGYMLGSVFQNPKAYAEALYTTGMNLVARKSPIAGTQYILDETRVSIRLPHTDYFYKNMFL